MEKKQADCVRAYRKTFTGERIIFTDQRASFITFPIDETSKIVYSLCKYLQFENHRRNRTFSEKGKELYAGFYQNSSRG